MTPGRRGVPGERATPRMLPALKAADWLALAAAPTFAAMAARDGLAGAEAAAAICSSAGVSPMSGMATMYLLMAVFHAAPWLKLAHIRQRGAPGPR